MVNFRIAQGTGSLSSPTAVTSSTGYASVTLTLTNFTANVQLTACVAPANNPCQTVYGNSIAQSLLTLQAVAGAGQVVVGRTFQPLLVRVTDTAVPPDPILGASVLFQSAVLRGTGASLPGNSQTGAPVVLSSSQESVMSDANGLASYIPSVGTFSGDLDLEIQVSTGTSAILQDAMESFPQESGGSSPPPIFRGRKVAPLQPPETWLSPCRGICGELSP